MGNVRHKYPQKNTLTFLFLPGQATLYNVGLWLYNENMLVSTLYIPIMWPFQFIPASSGLYMGDQMYVFGLPEASPYITVLSIIESIGESKRIHEIYFRTFNDFHLRLFVDSQFRVLFVPFSPHSLHMFPPFLSRGGSPGSAGLQHWFQGSRSCTRQRYGDGPRWGV